MLINCLLFLVGINFLHYGQLFLPVICLILFIDNKLQFKVNNPKVFILLCLFAISFYAFSYKLGFYSVMGFTFPMAYYIGCNMKEVKENNIKKIIYLFAFAMGFHIVLNLIYEISTKGFERLINSSSHYDFWTRDRISSTIVALNFSYLASMFYYINVYENNKGIKCLYFITFAFDFLFCLVTGRRTTLLLLFACFIFSIIYDNYHNKRNNYKKYLNLFLYCLIVVIIIFLFLYFDFGGIYSMFDGFYIIEKLKRGLDSNRFQIFLDFLKLAPNHLWGGQEISNILQTQIHDLWSDVYDYAGIITWLLMLIYSIHYLMIIIKLYKTKVKDKILFLSLFLAITIQMFLEPMMSGASLFLIISIIVGTLIEKLLDCEL